MKEIDILKFIYQSEFGPGHLISDVKMHMNIFF